MGKASRDKGKRGEREVAQILREHGYDAHRGQQYKGGADSPDVVGLPGFHIEVKRTEQARVYDFMEQAKAESAAGEIPLVVHRQNGREWLAVMTFSDFLEVCACRSKNAAQTNLPHTLTTRETIRRLFEG